MSFFSKMLPTGSRKKSRDISKDTVKDINTEGPKRTMEGASSSEPGTFGKALRKDFLFDPNYVNLNHGSFGTYPRQVRDALRQYQDRAEARPDHFIRYEYPGLLDKSRAALEKLLHAPTETIVIVQNATTAVNTVLRNLTYADGDVIIYFDTIYGACEKVVAYMEESTAAEGVKVSLKLPASDGEVVAEFTRAVKQLHGQGKKVRVAIFDTVSSMPGVRVPFEALGKACKELGVLSMVDAAHSVGQLDVDLGKLDFDFFVSNCHKWLFVPRGCAVFYVPERNQHLMRSTLPTSHGFPARPKRGQHILNPFEASGKSAFVSNFEFVGTIDNAPYLCVEDALKYRESIGGEEAIRGYCTKLNREAGKRLAESWKTEVLDNADGTMTDCFMSMVRVPLDVDEVKEIAMGSGKTVDEYELGVFVRDFLTSMLVREYNTFMALTVLYQGAWWVRLSATVYLDMDDFEWGGSALAEACEKVSTGEFLAWLKEKQQAK